MIKSDGKGKFDKVKSSDYVGKSIGSGAYEVTGSGAKVKLNSFKGDKNIVLYFYPKDLTPGCTTEGLDFSKLKTQFGKLDTVIYGVSMDSVDRHNTFIEKHSFKIELISDPDHKLCDKLGVYQQKKLYGKTFMGIVRSTFVIDKNSKIVAHWDKVKVDGHAQEVLEFIKSELP